MPPTTRRELLSLAKGDNPIAYKEAFENALDNEQPSELKEVGVFALLFILKLKEEKYINKSIQWLSDSDEDYELRSKCALGIGEAFWGTKNIKILKRVNSLFEKEPDEWLKARLFLTLLSVYGIDERERFLKTGVVEKYHENLSIIYAETLDHIRKIIYDVKSN